MSLRHSVLIIAASAALLALRPNPGWAVDVTTAQGLGLDGEATENRNTTTNEIVYGFNGTKVNMNARYNGYNNGFPPGDPLGDTDGDDRNEFWLMRFDLSAESNKSQITNTALKLTAWRTSNLQKDLRIWGVNAGTTGLNTFSETSILFADLPGFVMDNDITTTSVDPSTTTYLGDFLFPNHPGDIIPAEGDLLTINQSVLDTTGPNGTSEPAGGGVAVQSSLDGFLRSLGPTDMALFLVGGVASNGQVRIGVKETLATETGVFQCPAGECAPIMSYDLTAGQPGDFDSDNDVDGRDFLEWQRGNSPSPLSSTDLIAWQNNYGAGGLGALAAVPEPSTALLSLTMTVLVTSRRRQR
jgi:hypothetical protein